MNHFKKWSIAMIAAALLMALAGCGGGGSGSTAPTSAAVSVSVSWPARSRGTITGVSSAQSVIITVQKGGTSGADVVFATENRNTAPASYTASYSSPTNVALGTFTLVATFYAQTGGTGSVVGTVSTPVTVTSSGGTISNISATANIATVAVAASQTVTVGQSATLTVTALDKSGNAVVVTPGSIFMNVTAGTSFLSYSSSTGQVTGVAPGTATVTATIDGITSTAVSVVVAPATSSAVAVSVSWPVRSRGVITGLTSAQSVVITIQKGSSTGSDVVFATQNRNTAPAAYTASYTSPTSVALGTFTLVATFYAQTGGTGAVVGTATTPVTVTSTGGTISNVSASTNIASVVIAPNQFINTGEVEDLTVTALDSKSNTIALTPGSIKLNVTTGSSFLSISSTDQAQGVAAGTAMVTATIDGVVSPAVAVNVYTTNFEETVSNTGNTGGLFAGLYDKVRLRVHGITSASTTVAVTIGSKTVSSPTIAYTDTTVPSGAAPNGGAIDFIVPYPLTSGTNTVTVTYGGTTLATGTVTVSDTNPYATFTMADGTQFVVDLRADMTPNTVANFVGLATGSKTWYTYVFGQGTLSGIGGAAGTTVTGSGTNFTTFFKVGDLIGEGSQIATITAIASDTQLTISAAPGYPDGWASSNSNYEQYAKRTPVTNTPFYNGTTFHRIIAQAWQGGDILSKLQLAGTTLPSNEPVGTGNPGFSINFESSSLTHVNGAFAMARDGANVNNVTGDPNGLNTAGSQFFFDNGDNTSIWNSNANGGNPSASYAVFGLTVEGLAQLQKITLNEVITSVVISGRLGVPPA